MLERPVSELQLRTLRWIADGANTDSPPSQSYKATALALQTRRLAKVDRRKGHPWEATITELGLHYLKSGAYPSVEIRYEPSRTVRRDSQPIRRTPRWFESDFDYRTVNPPLAQRPIPEVVALGIEATPESQLRRAHLPRAKVLANSIAQLAIERGWHARPPEAFHRWSRRRPNARKCQFAIDTGLAVVGVRLHTSFYRVSHLETEEERELREQLGYLTTVKYDRESGDDLLVEIQSRSDRTRGFKDSRRFDISPKLIFAIERIGALQDPAPPPNVLEESVGESANQAAPPAPPGPPRTRRAKGRSRTPRPISTMEEIIAARIL